jgi:hypothetical protein
MVYCKQIVLLSSWNKMKSGSSGVRETYMKTDFGYRPNNRHAGPGEILKFRSVQTSSWLYHCLQASSFYHRDTVFLLTC